MQFHAPRRSVNRRTRFIHAEMAIQPDPEQRQIKTRPDQPIVFLRDVLRVWVDAMKVLRRKIYIVPQISLPHVSAKAFIVGGKATEFIQRKNFGLLERDLPGSHRLSYRGENWIRCMPGWQAHAQFGVRPQPVPPEARDAIQPCRL